MPAMPQGCPLNLSYWHGPVERASLPSAAVDSNRLLAAARLLASKKKEAFEAETWRFINIPDLITKLKKCVFFWGGFEHGIYKYPPKGHLEYG